MINLWRASLGSLSIALLLAGYGAAQDKTQVPLVLPTETKVTSSACAGKPFGVAQVTLEYPSERDLSLPRDQLPRVTEAGGRVFYPACSRRVDADGIQSLQVLFLFVGDDALSISVHALGTSKHVVKVDPHSNEHEKLLAEWWRTYVLPRDPRLQSPSASATHYYLQSMLARRLKLPAHQPAGPLATVTFDSSNVVGEVLSYLTGTTSIRGAMQNQRLLNPTADDLAADMPLPTPTAPPAVSLPEALRPDVELEPIASHVPAECFYVRCRRFTDYLWLRKLVDNWGGSVDQFVAMESLDYDVRRGVERRLGLAVTDEVQASLDDAIDDFAIIGTDLFFREGPSVGLLLQAKDEAALAELIRNQRQTILAEKEAKERTVMLGADKVQLLETADGRVRSYYAVSGKYHLITTSSYIAWRFFSASRGRESLAGLREFRFARQKMPLARGDDVFIYLSDPFFRLLVGPHYRVEMTRRAVAARDLQELELARLAAVSENSDASSVAALRKSGFLAEKGAARPDGSEVQIRNGYASDSLRGVAGAFLPIPDVEIMGVTRSEVREYREFATWYRSQWERLDPVTLAIARRPGKVPGRETVALDIVITPYLKSQYGGWSDHLWASDTRLTMEGSALIAAELGLQTPFFHPEPLSIFGGVQDIDLPFWVERGEMKFEKKLASTPWWNPSADWIKEPFIGLRAGSEKAFSSNWGTLRALANAEFDPQDRDGYAEQSARDRDGYAYLSRFQAARFQGNQVTLAQKRVELVRTTPGLKVVPAERPAQLRLSVKDLSGSKLSKAIDAAGYLRARQVSAANAYLLRLFDQQLRVPPQDIPQAAVSVVGGRPSCPLGGEYSLGSEGTPALWLSSAWSTASLDQIDQIPEDYRLPFTEWLHGLNLEFSLDATTLRTHVEFEVDR